MEFTTSHLQFVKSTTHFLARTMINNFNKPFKTEFNKISTFWSDPKYFYPEISSQIKYNFNINLYYIKIQLNIARATINGIKIFNIQKHYFIK